MGVAYEGMGEKEQKWEWYVKGGERSRSGRDMMGR